MKKIAAFVAVLLLGHAARALACGCLAPPDPAVPIVQAGERILFSRANGVITAHIQILYAGDAQDFGWLLPLPSVPDLALGTDELFADHVATTQPQFVVERQYDGCSSGGSGFSCGGTGSGADVPLGPGTGTGPSPAVSQSSIGPYDYAVLHADSKDELLGWLAANHYFVPAGTDAVVAPYIHDGAYFLALKLKSGEPTGAIQPVIVSYASDLPMIPITLTSVGARPDMGIQVFMLGAGRAIPRNYAHTVLDDAAIDWLGGADNYNDIVIRATHEAEGRHTFITEYAGTSSIMVGKLDPPGRFGTQAALAGSATVGEFIDTLGANGFLVGGQLPAPLVAILAEQAPMPLQVAQLGVSPAEFYNNLGYYGTGLAGWPAHFDAAATAAEVFDRIVAPTRAAGALFRAHPYLTRLYTTLSPADMTRDPVFAENPALPPVSNVHKATAFFHCNGDALSATTPVSVETEQGYFVSFAGGANAPVPSQLPASRRIEALTQDGPPVTLVDNDSAIASMLAARPSAERQPPYCGLGRHGRVGGAIPLAAIGLARLLRRRRAGSSRRA
jgi:hypothetical protein